MTKDTVGRQPAGKKLINGHISGKKDTIISGEPPGESLMELTANLSDFALFLTVMKNKTAYRSALSIILGEDDIQLKEVKVEQVILNKSGKRARMIFLKGIWPNIPSQNGARKSLT